MMMNPNTEIRKLRPAELYTLARILAVSDSWKTLMGIVPKEGNENEPKFNTEHFALIEQASCQQRRSGAEIFLEEWGTMGKQRPTLKSMLDLLVKVQLFRAADYVAVDLLKGPPPERPTSGPAAPIDISDEEIAKLLGRKISELDISDPRVLGSKESLDSVLNGLDYPSQLSIQSSVEHRGRESRDQLAGNDFHREQRYNGLELAEETSTLRIGRGERNGNNSNLIQFTKSAIEETCENNRRDSIHRNNSNLIQFSSESIRNTNAKDSEKKFSLANDVCRNNLGDNLQRQNINYSSSSNNEDSSQRIIKKENIPNSGYNAAPFSNSNNYNEFELQSSELPACIADIGRGAPLTYSEVESCELPQHVVEIARQRFNQSNTTAEVESSSEAILSNDSTSSDTSSDYSTNATSPSEDNTESNIPICVNYPPGNLANKELVSAELPRFVADLGHRRNDDSSSKTIDDVSEFSDRSSIEQFQYFDLNSQELPLVISECNKMRSRLEDDQRELQSAELPQCVAELQNKMKN